MDSEASQPPSGARPRRKKRTWPAFVIACAAIAFWAYRGSVMQGEADLAVGLAVVGLESLIVWGGLYAFSLRRNGSMKINLLYLAGVILCGSLGFWAGAASVA